MADRPLTDEEMDARIEEWHDATPTNPVFWRGLHEHLGMTWDEYAARFGPAVVRQAAAEDRALDVAPGRRLTEEANGG